MLALEKLLDRARVLALGAFVAFLSVSTSGAQITVDAGPDRTVAATAPLTLNGTITGLRSIDYWTADGNGTEENKLVKYDSVTGVTFAGPIQTSTGTLYGFVNDLVKIGPDVYGVAPLLQALFTLDGNTGLATNVGGPMGSPSIRGLAYDAAGDVLYGVDYNNNNVVSLDRTTGQATVVVSNMGHTKTTCLAFDPTSGLLYAFGESSDWLFTIDPMTGATANVMLLPRAVDETYDDLQFFEGELYAITWNYTTFDTQLRRIDLVLQTVEDIGGVLPDVSAHCLQINTLPEPFEWRKARGPGTVAFSDPESLTPSVTFSRPGTYELQLRVFGDAGIVKDSVMVTALATNPNGGTPGAPAGPIPEVSFATTQQAAAENTGSVTVTVQLTAPLNDNVVVPFSLSGTATPTDDYSASPNPLVITAGLLSADVTLTLVDDGTDEEDETISLLLGKPANTGLGAVAVHQVTINDDDPAPTVSFTSAAQSVAEGAGTAQVTVQLSAVSGRDVTVPVSLSGTAQTPDDYTLSPAAVLLPAGTTTGSFTLTLVDDALDEVDETIQLDLGSPTNATLGATTQHVATVLDDDGPTVAFTSSSQTLGEAGPTATLTLQLSGTSPQDVSVPFSAGGTASDPADYTLGASPAVITAGQTTTDITITLTDDALDEDDETIVVTLGAPTNASLGATTQHTVTLTDDDATPSVAFTTGAQTVQEDVGSTPATLQLSAVSGRAVTVPFNVGGTATNPDDYTITGSPLVIPAGSLTADIVVTVVDDSLSEVDEQVGITLGTPLNASLGALTQHTVTIVDNDGGGSLRSTLTIAPATEHVLAGSTLRLTVVDEDLPGAVWSLADPTGGAAFLESGLAHAAGNPVHLVAGREAGALLVTATDPGTGRTGTAEVTVEPLVHDLSPFADVPGGDAELDGAALAFRAGRALLTLNPRGGRGTLVLVDPSAAAPELRVAAPRPVRPRSAVRGVAFDGHARAWAVVEETGGAGEARELVAFDGRLRQLDRVPSVELPLPFLTLEEHAVLGTRLVVGSRANGGELAAVGALGEPLGALPLPAPLDATRLSALAATPDGGWLVADAHTLSRIDAGGRLGRFDAGAVAAHGGAVRGLATTSAGLTYVALSPPAADQDGAVLVLDGLGRLVATLDATPRPLAVAADERGRVLVYEQVDEPGVLARLLLATPRRAGVAIPELVLEPREAWLRPGLVQTFFATTPARPGALQDGLLTWRTESGFFLDTGLEISHANPVHLVAGPTAGEFELTLELDVPGAPAARSRVIVTSQPTTDQVLLVPRSPSDSR